VKFALLANRHGYFIDPDEADQGAEGSGKTIYHYVNALDAGRQYTLFFPHYADDQDTTVYTLSTSESIPAEFKVMVQPGAIIAIDTGITLTLDRAEQIIAQPNQQIFSLTGSGAATFTNGGVAYPEWWGVDGTADEVQINQALDSISSGKVKLLAKTYGIAAAVEIPTDIHLEGAGFDGTKIVPAATMEHIVKTDTSATSVVMSNVWVYGSGTKSTDERGFFSDSGTDITVTGCKFENMTIGAQLEGVTRGSILNNTFKGIVGTVGETEGYGVLCNSDCTDISTINNKFHTIERHAIYYSSGTSNSIMSFNEINGTNEGALAVYATNAQNPCTNILVLNNIVRDVTTDDNDGHAIGMTGNVQDITISGNIIDTVATNGVQIQNGIYASTTKKPMGITITDNNISNIGTASPVANYGTGIRLLANERVQISGNTIYNTNDNGIEITSQGAETDKLCKNIIINGNTIDTVVDYGIRISGGANYSNITLGINHFNSCGENTSKAYGVENFVNACGSIWIEDLITYADFDAASTTPTHAFIDPLLQGCIITGVWWSLDTEFSGGSVSAATLEFGRAADPNGFFPAEDVFTGAGAGLKDSGVTNWGAYLYDSGNNQTLQYFGTGSIAPLFTLRLTDDNGDALTAGSARVWLRYEQVRQPATK